MIKRRSALTCAPASVTSTGCARTGGQDRVDAGSGVGLAGGPVEPLLHAAVIQTCTVHVVVVAVGAVVADAVYTPALVTVPPLAGLTDQVREPPLGGLGVKEAVNVVVDPAATVIKEGFTEILTETLEGVVLGLGKPPPQPVRPRMIKASGSATALRRLTIIIIIIMSSGNAVVSSKLPHRSPC